MRRSGKDVLRGSTPPGCLVHADFPLPCASQHWAQEYHSTLVQLNKVHRLEFAPVPGVITAKPQCPPQQFRKFEAVGALILRSTFVIKAIKANHRGVSALHFHGALLGAAFPGAALTYICECIEFAGLKPFTSSWDGIKSYYNNQEFRAQSTMSCFLQPGGVQTLQIWTLRFYGIKIFHLTFSSCEINSSSSQRQVILMTRIPFLLSHQPLLLVSPCSALIKLFLNGRERRKKDTLNISSSKKPIDRQILWIPPSTAIFELRTS